MFFRSFFMVSASAKQTQNLARKLATKIVIAQNNAEIFPRESASSPRKSAYIVGLAGNLGSGKTTFIQGFAKALKIKEKILSPTFVIQKRFKIKDLRFKSFYHIDCYRIEKPQEISDLGWKEIIQNQQNIVVIEWADKIKKIMPKNVLWIKFEHLGGNRRKITIQT